MRRERLEDDPIIEVTAIRVIVRNEVSRAAKTLAAHRLIDRGGQLKQGLEKKLAQQMETEIMASVFLPKRIGAL